jgi:hypothetical protein
VQCSDPFCTRCLRMGHAAKDCTNQIRCWACHGYGHKKRGCIKWRSTRRAVWVPKSKPQPAIAPIEPCADVTKAASLTNETLLHPPTAIHVDQTTVEPNSSSSTILLHTEFPSLLCTSLPPPPPLAAMANFVINPLPYLPLAMFIEDGGQHHRARRSVFI